MSHRLRLALLLPLALLLSACGPTRHVFPPDAAIQQLQLTPAGQWQISVRINNYSYDTEVHFLRLDASLTVGTDVAGSLAAPLKLTIAARSADVTELQLTPTAAAAKALAALGNNGSRSLAYHLKGTITVGDDKGGGRREFPLDHNDYLSPVPGVPGTYR